MRQWRPAGHCGQVPCLSLVAALLAGLRPASTAGDYLGDQGWPKARKDGNR